MHRLLIIVALVGLLAGCASQGDGTSAEPIGSVPMASGSESGAVAGAPSPACAEAFAPVADMGLSETSELGDLTDELQPTIESCESVADWIAGAQEAIGGEVRPGTADLLLRIRCESPTLSNTAICEELS
jgi:hypothetical protein